MKKSINDVVRYYKGANVKVTLSIVMEDDDLNYILKVEKFPNFNLIIEYHYFKTIFLAFHKFREIIINDFDLPY